MKKLFILFNFVLVSISLQAYDFYQDGLYYTIISEDESTVKVTNAYDGAEYVQSNYSGDIIIPEEVTYYSWLYSSRSYKVVEIGDYAFYQSCVSSIQLTEGIEKIGDYAFCESQLTSISLPYSLKVLGAYSFSNSYLQKLTFEGNNISYIGKYAFAYSNLSGDLKIPNGIDYIGEWAFTGIQAKTIEFEMKSISMMYPIIDKFAFAQCPNLEGIDLNAVYHTFKGNVFAGCPKLTKIDGWGCWINDSVYNIIEDNVLYCMNSKTNQSEIISCPGGLTSYVFPQKYNIHRIGSHAFAGCKKIIDLEIPNTVEEIDSGALMLSFNSYDETYRKIVIPNSVKLIGWEPFGNGANNWEIFSYITNPIDVKYMVLLKSGTLHVPYMCKKKYENISYWKNRFDIIDDLENSTCVDINDDISSFIINDETYCKTLTYTRNFSDAMVGNWQAWYMPCDFDYDDLSEDFDVAEIAGVLFDQSGENYVAFRKMTKGTVKAHTPYVVRAKEAGDAVITTTTTLQPTSGAKSFSMQSAYNNFTFGGVYENSYLSAEQPTYALNKSGNFALMGETVYLRPFRIYMRITDREDNPYAAVTAPQEVKVVVLGDDETSVDEIHNAEFIMHNDDSSEIYNLGGQKLQKLQKGINIVNGKKVMY